MEQPPRELSAKAVLLGLLLALLFGAANAYLGMKAGQTVSATIPAAVIALGVFRLPFFRGSVLEQNITRTAASVGEALVASAIYTIPAFLLAEIGGRRLWNDLREHYWEATLILLCGGLLGVFFIIFLRRALCTDAGLPWPEAVASVNIVQAGDSTREAPRLLFGAMGAGALLQLLKSDRALPLIREYAEGFLAFPKAVLHHFDFQRRPLGQTVHGGGIPWSTPAISPALIGIGYIIGPRYAFINAAGGVLAWWVLIPLLLFFRPELPGQLAGSPDAGVVAYTVWHNVVRPIAVGMMLVAAGYTLFSMRKSLTASIRGALAVAQRERAEAARASNDRDLPARWILVAIVALLAPVTAIYFHFTGSWTAATVASIAMTLTGFVLAAVGGYLVGLVGASNQPLSGLTLSALVITALLLLSFGVHGASGVAAVLGVAAVVAAACSISGSLVQDFRAGYLLGGTPWKMQLVEILAVTTLSFFLMGPIIALHESNLEAGGIGGRALPAPQAGLMAQLAQGIVGGDMAWGLLAIGAAFGLATIAAGARAPMLLAVGMYLPFDTSAAMFVGGVIKLLAERWAAQEPEAEQRRRENRGMLLASGLIAGEAITGILLAVIFLAGIPRLDSLLGWDLTSVRQVWGGWAAAGAFALLAWILIRIPAGGVQQDDHAKTNHV